VTVAVAVFAVAAILGIVYAVVNATTTRGPFIQHHFDDGAHQFDSGKLGIWLFLGQEILFFSALFVAYIIYRHNHPEVFAYAHLYLDVNMGAINTAVLILSSLTAAWAVRAAQLGQKRLLIGLIVVTLVCAFGFLVVKYFEYSHKFHIGNFPSTSTFLAIYFTLTGLHGLHVLGGMVVNAWYIGPGSKLWKTDRQQFTNRVETAGLFWHFVDLVWIFLFPVLYLL